MGRLPPDWVVYAGVVAAIVTGCLIARRQIDARPPRAPSGRDKPVAAASLFDPAVVVRTPWAADPAAAGTAFSVSSAGVWLTARHVVEGCRTVALMLRPDRGVLAEVSPDLRRDVAVLRTAGGAPALPLADAPALRVAEPGYQPGFPQGEAGEVASRLLGRQTLVLRWTRRLRGAHAEPVLAWAETGRTDGLVGDLSGLSGAPVLDGDGRVLGLTLAESPRRGRIYTTDVTALRQALARAGAAPGPASTDGEAFTDDSYGRLSRGLRAALSVAQVRCLAR